MFDHPATNTNKFAWDQSRIRTFLTSSNPTASMYLLAGNKEVSLLTIVTSYNIKKFFLTFKLELQS